MLQLLQEHTVKIYNLDEKRYIKKTVPARNLIKANRFDMFAKLIYIHYRKSNPELALRVYEEHIIAFNPDLKEPGRDDKNGINDFVQTFDNLIDNFKDNEFDSTISLIPVAEDGTPLDGSHRIASLAYFNKEVDILQFNEVKPKSNFDYLYFQKRGLSWATSDLIAKLGTDYIKNLHVACLWSKIGKERAKEFAINCFTDNFPIYYQKEIRIPLEGLGRFMYEIYKHQDWVGNKENDYVGARSKALSCYDRNQMVHFIVFQAKDLEEVLSLKDKIRLHYNLDKHTLHITDNQQETNEILDLILTDKIMNFTSSKTQFLDKISEQITVFKNIYWLNLKIKIAKLIGKK